MATTARKTPARKRVASTPDVAPSAVEVAVEAAPPPARKSAAKKAEGKAVTAKAPAKKATASKPAEVQVADEVATKKAPAKKAATKKAATKKAAPAEATVQAPAAAPLPSEPSEPAAARKGSAKTSKAAPAKPPTKTPTKTPSRKAASKKSAVRKAPAAEAEGEDPVRVESDAVPAPQPSASVAAPEAASAPEAAGEGQAHAAAPTVAERPSRRERVAPPAEPARVAEATVEGVENVAPAPAPRPAAEPPEVVQPHRLERADAGRALLAWHPGSRASRAAAAHEAESLQISPQPDGAIVLPAQAIATVDALLKDARRRREAVHLDAEAESLLVVARDAQARLERLQQALPNGPVDPAWRRLLRAPLAPFQAEGAMWLLIAGRGLLADEPGLGKGVQAIAALKLARRLFGVRRAALLTGSSSRMRWDDELQRWTGHALTEPGASADVDASTDAAALRWFDASRPLAGQPGIDASWRPELVIVDEPQRWSLEPSALERWLDPEAGHSAPLVWVLCGAPLESTPEIEPWLDVLDRPRQGAWAAWQALKAVGLGERPAPDEATLEAWTDDLSRTVLQRQREDVAGQVPSHRCRLVRLPLGPAQARAHAEAAERLIAALTPWREHGFLSPGQWPVLAQAWQAVARAGAPDVPDLQAALAAETKAGALSADRLDQAVTGCAWALQPGALKADAKPRLPACIVVGDGTVEAHLADLLLESMAGRTDVGLFKPEGRDPEPGPDWRWPPAAAHAWLQRVAAACERWRVARRAGASAAGEAAGR